MFLGERKKNTITLVVFCTGCEHDYNSRNLVPLFDVGLIPNKGVKTVSPHYLTLVSNVSFVYFLSFSLCARLGS